MKKLVIMLTLVMTTSAMAQLSMNLQQFTIPETVPWSIDGRNVGTATVSSAGSDVKMYLRLTDGTFVATVVHDRNGTKTIYDPNGKIIDKLPPIPAPQ
jgi:hypothetical protein